MSVFLDDDQVSCTVTFDPLTEGPKLPAALDIFQYQLKGVSFLPQLEQGAFAQVRRGTRRRGIHTQLFWVVGCGWWCVMLCCVPCANLPCAVCRVPCAVCCIWLLTQSRLLSPLLRPFRPPRHCTDAVRGDHERPVHTDPCVTEKHETRFFVQVKRRGGKGGGGGDTRRRLLRRVRAAVTVS